MKGRVLITGEAVYELGLVTGNDCLVNGTEGALGNDPPSWVCVQGVYLLLDCLLIEVVSGLGMLI